MDLSLAVDSATLDLANIPHPEHQQLEHEKRGSDVDDDLLPSPGGTGKRKKPTPKAKPTPVPAAKPKAKGPKEAVRQSSAEGSSIASSSQTTARHYNTADFAPVLGYTCAKCVETNNICMWRRDTVPGAGACLACKGKKSACHLPSDGRKIGGQGPTPREDEHDDDDTVKVQRPKGKGKDKASSTAPSVTKKRKRESGSHVLDDLREENAQVAGSPSFRPSAYGGQQPAHAEQAFPGLVAAMKGGDMWPNYLNVAANTNLQIDGTLNQILEAQRSSNSRAAQTTSHLRSLAASIELMAGAAVLHLRTTGYPDITREEVLAARTHDDLGEDIQEIDEIKDVEDAEDDDPENPRNDGLSSQPSQRS